VEKKMSLRTVVIWIAVVAVVMIAAGVGLLYLGAVAKVLPKGLGLFANLPDLVQAVIWIVVLAVIAVGAWVLMPKAKSGSSGEPRPQ
jgi:biotin transporter BioY